MQTPNVCEYIVILLLLAHLLAIYFALLFSTCIPKYIFPPLPNTIWLSLPEYANIELAPPPLAAAILKST